MSSMSTAALAAAAGCSVQQVRDLEALGVIAPATRSANGYRRFTPDHVVGLLAYRDLAYAVGPVAARRTMREVRALPLAPATALVGALHAGLAEEWAQALAARAALASIREEGTADAEPAAGDAMTISELAEALGVRASTLRFWESEGLVSPDRVATRAGSARSYPVSAVREARITAALRAGGYRVPDVRRALAAVRKLEVDDSLAALDVRLEAITRRTLALLRAGAHLAEVAEVIAPR